LREFNDKRQDSTGARKEEEEKSLAAGGVRVEFQHAATSKISVCSSRSRTLGIDLAAPDEHNLSR
jgi:hypothetical protein